MVVAVGAVLVFRGICGVFSGGGLFRVLTNRVLSMTISSMKAAYSVMSWAKPSAEGDFVDIIEKSLLLFLI
ncbi:MAG: hypothetical protein ACLS5C_08770 [Waltera sp.]